MKSRSTFILIAALLAFAPAQQSLGQADSASPEAQEDDSWRKKSLGQLRKEYRQSEESFYEAFNSVNSDDKFDITCKRQKSLGARRSERVCQAKFLWDYKEDLASASARTMTGAGDTGLGADQSARMERMQNQLRNEMSSLIAEVPVVKQAFAELATAKRHYETKMAE